MDGAQPVLIDTDIGDDVDDAFALALAVALPALRVVGVTTVAGPVEQRAHLAQHLLATGGRADVPVVAGSSSMRGGRAGAAKFSHSAVVSGQWSVVSGQWSDTDNGQLTTDNKPAATFISQLAYAHAPLTIIALGPLTNIAAALDGDPTLAGRARLVAMGGKLGVPYPDWNLRCDPAAARRVLRSGMPITLVGMHVTMQCQMRRAQMQRLFSDRRPIIVALARCVLAWRTWQRRIPILHDPLTVAVAADPSLVRLEPRRVRVLPGGFSLAERRGTPNALVCTAVDVERFHTLLDEYLLR